MRREELKYFTQIVMNLNKFFAQNKWPTDQPLDDDEKSLHCIHDCVNNTLSQARVKRSNKKIDKM